MEKPGQIELKQTDKNLCVDQSYRRVVLPFAIAEPLVWATYFYSFPAFLPTWEQDLGFSKASTNLSVL